MIVHLLTALAFGHAGAELAAVDPESPDVLETGFGVLLRSSTDPGWDWVCHEAVTRQDSILTPRYTESPGGVLLAVVPRLDEARIDTESVYRSADGCAWDPVEGLTGVTVSDAAFLDEDQVVGVTAGLDEADPNGLVRSSDGGRTWSFIERFDDPRIVLRVVGSADGHAWAASFDPLVPDGARIHHSADAGATWETHALDLSAWAGDDTLSVSVLATDGTRAWLGVADPEGHRLLLLEDGGSTVTVLLQEDGFLIDGAVDDTGGVWILEGSRDVLHAADGVDFAAVPGAPPAVGLGVDGSEARLATSAVFTGFLLQGLSPDGTVTPLSSATDLLGPLDCPAGTEGADICEALWELVEVPGGGDTGDTDTPDTDVDDEVPGCGCASGASPAWWALALPLMLLRRRR